MTTRGSLEIQDIEKKIQEKRLRQVEHILRRKK